MKTLARSASVALFTMFVVGCPMRVAVWIPGGAARPPTFLMARHAGGNDTLELGKVGVYPCGSYQYPADAEWLAFSQSWSTPLRRVQYGVVPLGFYEQVPAKPLSVGCHRFQTDGSGYVEFVIDSAGTATEVPR